MGQPNGTKAMRCPFCGLAYHLNNFNRRRGGNRFRGTLLDDTHLIACSKRIQAEEAEALTGKEKS